MTTLKLILSFLCTFNFVPRNQMKMNSSFTQQDILHYLEETDQETYHFFIDFEHPYFFTAGSRLSLYADENRWAIVFEKSGYNTGNFCGEIQLTYFGNCLQNLKSGIPGDESTSNIKTVILINNNDLEKIDNSEFACLVAPDKNTIKVRDTFLNIEHDTLKYIAKNIQREAYENPNNLIDFPTLIRYLEEENPKIYRATDEELKICLPADLPMLMQIDQWHHEEYRKYKLLTSPTEYHYQVDGKKPGDYETYRMIADVLVSKDTTKWRPTLKANIDWRNWLNAGHM